MTPRALQPPLGVNRLDNRRTVALEQLSFHEESIFEVMSVLTVTLLKQAVCALADVVG